uniref:Integrase, catalytic region, zinc finger, CCHC-type, peptidase aspartic, catalytic n=1 Tax=Tanacetum cinerariifolium TaxID=118510 RepID=A0A6L2NFH6_TANCI|nr:integrase, catalytic region, zinc finger, CCHC-type, peptidase aspartic, catalytic [Tanacetum cinerariifolium]
MIHCSAKATMSHNFLRLKEGGIYSVKNFAVKPNKGEYRVLKNDAYMLEFDGSTTIRKASVKADGFVRYPFQLQDFDGIESLDNNTQVSAGNYTYIPHPAKHHNYCSVKFRPNWSKNNSEPLSGLSCFLLTTFLVGSLALVDMLWSVSDMEDVWEMQPFIPLLDIPWMMVDILWVMVTTDCNKGRGTMKGWRQIKIDRLARSLLIQGLLNDIYSLIDSNKTAKDLWDALERQMCGSEYGEQDMKAQTQGDVNDALGYKKKAIMVTSDPLALVAEKMKITALLAKAFNRKKYYAKPTNNNLRTSSASSLANKKPEYVKLVEKKEDKRGDEKKRDMSKVKCYNYKKEGHFAKDCKKAKVKDYNYYKTKMLLAKKDSDEQVLLAQDQAWMESSSDSDQEINANMKANQQSKDLENQYKDLQEKYDVLIHQANTFEEQNNEFNEQMKVLNEKNADLLAQTEVLQDQLKIDEQEILFDKMSHQLVEMNNNVLRLQEKILEKEMKISELEGCISNKDVEIEKCLEILNECENKLHKIGQTNQTIHMIMSFKDTLYNGRKGIGFENPSYFEKAKDLRPSLYEEKVIGLGLCDSFDENNLFIFDDDSVRISLVSKMPFSKKPRDSLNVCSKRYSKHMTGNRALLTNFVEKFLGTVRFSNNDFTVIAGYGDVVIGSMTIKKVYYVEGLGHNLVSVG